MTNHGTASQLKVDGAYVEFQLAVLRALPRDIDPDIADGWRDNGESLARVLREALLPPIKPVAEATPTVESRPQPLLIPIGTTIVAATKIPFVVRDHFVVNTGEKAPVKISHLGNNFREWFFHKEEQAFGGSTLKYGKLSRCSVDNLILKELGGEEQAETILTELFSLMAVQKNGQTGSLLTNGYANIFYVKDMIGCLRSVRVHWIHGGWRVLATASPRTCQLKEWNDGDQVFSRDSRLSSVV